jgi:hypothetical protein
VGRERDEEYKGSVRAGGRADGSDRGANIDVLPLNSDVSTPRAGLIHRSWHGREGGSEGGRRHLSAPERKTAQKAGSAYKICKRGRLGIKKDRRAV